MTPSSRLPRGRTSFFAHTCLLQAITFVARPTATYRALDLDVPVYWLGVVGASFAVAPLLLAIPSGQAVDRFGEWRVMIVGSMVVVASCVLFASGAWGIHGVMLASVLLGSGHLCSVVGQQALVANSTGRAGYDRAFGYYTFVASLGQALGPGLIVWFGGRGAIPDTERIFAWSTGLAVALVAFTLALPRPRREDATAQPTGGSLGNLVRTPGLVRALVVSSVVLAAVDVTLVYLPALGSERHIAATTVGLLLAVRALTSMASRLFLGALVARYRRQRVLVGSVALAAMTMALTTVTMPVSALFVVVALLGLGLGAGQPITMSWLAEVAPPGARGRAMSLRLTGNRLGQVVFPSAAGLFAGLSGAAGVLQVTAAGLTAVAVTGRGFTTQTATQEPSSLEGRQDD